MDWPVVEKVSARYQGIQDCDKILLSTFDEVVEIRMDET